MPTTETQTVETRRGEKIEVDTSEEAFKNLPQEFLRDYRTGDIVKDFTGINFKMVGVASSCSCGLCKDVHLVIWGYYDGGKRVSYYYPPEEADFKKIEG